MEPILELLLKKKVEPNELIFWLNSSIQLHPLKEFEHIKHDFVPAFLNFIRDQTSSFLHANSHTGLTPNKSTSQLKISKYISPSKLSSKPSLQKRFSSKAKTLDFSQVIPSAPQKDNTGLCNHLSPPGESCEYKSSQTFALKTPNKFSCQPRPLSFSESPVSAFQSYNTSTPKNDNTRAYSRGPRIEKSPVGIAHSSGTTKMSERKNVLADFIVIDSAKKSCKKRGGVRESLKEWNYQSTATKKQNEFNIEDKESFPLIGAKPPVDQQRKRRINPTRVASLTDPTVNNTDIQNQGSSAFGVLHIPCKQSEPNAFLMAPEAKVNSLEQERKLLRENKEKLQKTIKSQKFFSSSCGLGDSSFTSLTSSKSANTTDEELNISKVTSCEELITLSQIYSNLILYNMIPNIMVELYFLLQLLTISEDQTDGCSADEVSEILPLLSYAANCIYFSIKTLSNLNDCLALFDRGFIKALSENSRIISFDMPFRQQLIAIMENSSGAKQTFVSQPKSPILSVSFQSETDNKNNFPTVPAFQLFKKQRDLFYEILRIWEDSRLIPGWSYFQGLGNRVRQVLALQSEPTNLTHLARLFLSQLLTMCKGDELINPTSDVEDISFLSQLKKQQPEKYKRLYERLVTPSKFGGPVPTPSFVGSQEFFKNFIIAASSQAFNAHLKNVLVAKIIELNKIEYQVTDQDEREHSGDHLWPDIISTMQNLRLMAKFLGFLEFLPYQTSETLPDIVVVNHLEYRNKVIPPLPLLELVRDGASSGCLVVVVPWVVEFLCIADPVALHTRYYLTLVFGLMMVYRLLFLTRVNSTTTEPNCEKCLSARMTPVRSVSPGNCLLLKLLVGWLLSLPNTPEGLFYVNEEEADIDLKEHEALKKVLATCYSQLCQKCLAVALRSQEEDMSVSMIGSPVKTDFCVTPLKGAIDRTPCRWKAKEFSPLKTPSKLLHVSMLQTPDQTPDKPLEENTDDSSKLILDSCNLIDCNTLLVFCPFVHELKGVLNDYALGNIRSANGGSIRKITPLAAPDKTNEKSEKTLQNLLEESFFHNQPSSTKKTVDFIVERVFSNTLRSVRFSIIPKFKDGCVNELRSCISSAYVVSPALDKVTDVADRKVQKLSSDLATRVKQEVLVQTNQLVQHESLKQSLQFLLPIDLTAKSLEMCCKIIQRSLLEKVNGWIVSHLTSGFCVKELTAEAHKYIKQYQKSLSMEGNLEVSRNSSAPAVSIAEDHSLDLFTPLSPSAFCGTDMKTATTQNRFESNLHNEDIPPPSTILFKIKCDLKALMVPWDDASSGITQGPKVLERLQELKNLVEKRKDLTLPAVKALETLTADWMAALCVCHPDCISEDMLIVFCELWLPSEGIFDNTSVLSVFLCSRTVMLLGQLPEKEHKDAWDKLEEALLHLVVRSRLISLSQLQDLCISLTRHLWPQSILNGISCLIKNFLDKLKIKAEFRDEIELQFVDWVGWITDEMSNLKDSCS